MRTTRIRRPLALLLATAGLGAVAAPAHGAEAPRVAVSADGTAHFGWQRGDGARTLLQGRSRAVDGTLGETQYVSPATGSAPVSDVVAGANGTALHVWLELGPGVSVVRVRRRSTDGSLGAPQTLSGTGVVGIPETAVDPDGNAVVTWSRLVDNKVVVEARRRAANGTLSSVKRISSAAATYNAAQQDIAVDAAGNAVIAWTVSGTPSYVQVRRRAADGTLSAIQNLTSGGGAADEPEVGVDGAGNAVVTFRRVKEGAFVSQVRRRSAAGTLSTTEDLSTQPGAGFVPRVVVSPSAGAVAAWQQKVGDQNVLFAARRAPGGSWSEPDPISAGGASVNHFALDIDAAGNALILMRRAVDADTAFLQIRRRAAGGTLSSVQDITPADGFVSDFDLAVEAGGGAVATWTAPVGNVAQAHARRRTAAGELSEPDQLSY